MSESNDLFLNCNIPCIATGYKLQVIIFNIYTNKI